MPDKFKNSNNTPTQKMLHVVSNRTLDVICYLRKNNILMLNTKTEYLALLLTSVFVLICFTCFGWVFTLFRSVTWWRMWLVVFISCDEGINNQSKYARSNSQPLQDAALGVREHVGSREHIPRGVNKTVIRATVWHFLRESKFSLNM